MLSIMSGVVVTGAGAFGLWSFLPKNGMTHRLATVPVIDSAIPTVIVATLAIGISLIINGAVG